MRINHVQPVLPESPHTSFELALLTDLDRYMLARRLPECETAGRVRRGAMRRCTVTGRLAMEWLPA